MADTMSWWISLVNDGQVVELDEPHAEGGTFVIGGAHSADLNVTYNYGNYFWFLDLDGKTARDTIRVLAAAVAELGTERDRDYWAATPGNAGYTCLTLLRWATSNLDAVWDVR